MSIIVTQQVINGRSISLKVTPTISAAAFSTQAKTYRDQAEQFKITCEGVQTVLQNLINNLDEVLLVQGSLPELLELHSKLTELLAVYAKLAIIENVNDHLIEIDSVSNNLAELLVIYTNLTILQNIETNIDSVITVDTNITALLSISTNIVKLNTLYDNLTAILTLYDNIVVLQTLNTNITKFQDLHTNLNALLTIYNNLTDILTVENSIDSINTLADNIIKLQDLYTNLTALVTLYTNLSTLLNVEADLANINIVATDINKVNTVADNIAAIQSVVINLQAILDAEGNALTATIKASEASQSTTSANQSKLDAQTAELKSKDWAEKAVDVEVEAGKYSSIHHATKAGIDAAQTSEDRIAVAGDKAIVVEAKEDAVEAASLAEGFKNESKIVVFRTPEITENYTLLATDAGKLVIVNSPTNINIEVPANVFTAQQVVSFEQNGAGEITLTQGAGMVLNGDLKSYARYTVLQLIFKSATLALVVGGKE